MKKSHISEENTVRQTGCSFFTSIKNMLKIALQLKPDMRNSIEKKRRKKYFVIEK
jgi:hypothetical protein